MTRPGPNYPYVSTWPLIRHARAVGARSLAGNDEGLRTALIRGKRCGSLNVHAADRLAVRWLGVHPVEIWPEWFELDHSAG